MSLATISCSIDISVFDRRPSAWLAAVYASAMERLSTWCRIAFVIDCDNLRFVQVAKNLANPTGSGIAAKHRGDFGIYGIIDQQLYRARGGAADSGVSVLGRASMSPSDRNSVNLQVDAGIVFAGLIPGRPAGRDAKVAGVRSIWKF
jgi:hypothetical protein